jgi:transcriptional regulator with XRE-family HTH domain
MSETLGERLRERREYLGFSPARVAAHLKTDESRVLAFEADLLIPWPHEAEALSRLYKLSALDQDPDETVPESLAQAADLPESDRRELGKFAGYLRGRKTEATKGDKVRHVLRAKQDRDHECHWPGCDTQVPPARWGCRKHWFMLPKALRDRVWASYRPGQEVAMTPSREYLAVAREVQDWIREHVVK